MPRLRQPQPPPGAHAIFRDYAGRTVVLTDERWEHIVRNHPEMDGLELAIKTAVQRADYRGQGNEAGIEKLAARNLGPSRWLVVLVRYGEKGLGKVLTAYGTKDDLT